NRVNHANQFVPRLVQLKTGRTNINSVRPNVNIGRVNVNSVRPNVNTGRVNVNSVKSNVNTGRTNVNPVRPRVNTGSSNVNTVRSRQPVPTKTSNSFSPKRPQVNQLNQRRHFSKSHSPVSRPIVRNTARMTYSHAVKGNWGTAVKTSAGYNWRKTRPNSNYDSRSNFVKTVNVKGPQGRPKPVKAWPDLWIVVLRIGKLQGIGEFSGVGFISTRQMVINSPCLTDTKNWLFQCKRHLLASPKQTALELAIPGQTATGKESSNPFMAGSLPKTIHFCDSLQSDEDSFELIKLMILCTNFLTMVLDLENTKTSQQSEIASLKRSSLGDDASKHGRIDDNKISNSKVEDDKETTLEVKKCLDTSSW
ncbi:hypothetical protein Tco_0957412, partial [Tanacetum coccineum]